MFIYTAALALVPLSLAAPVVDRLAPIFRAADVSGRNTTGGYIVSIKSNTVDPRNRLQWLSKVLGAQGITIDDDTTQSLALDWSESIFNGISGTFSTEALNVLRQQPEVAWVEEDLEMRPTAPVTLDQGPWGLARISSGAAGLASKNPNLLNFPYTLDDSAGRGTHAFIPDSGCNINHDDLKGRANCFPSDKPCDDKTGHGTHIAATLGGLNFGVVKRATLHCGRITEADGTHTTSKLVTFLNAAAAAALSIPNPTVISISLNSAAPNISLERTVSKIIKLGVPIVVAAGNDAQDAGKFSPGLLTEAITVGATTIDDTFASFSNFGDKVDILAPGKDITSAGIGANDAVSRQSGTSFAAPHVAGVALQIMAIEGKLSPKALTARLIALSTRNAIKGLPDKKTPNLLVSNGQSSR